MPRSSRQRKSHRTPVIAPHERAYTDIRRRILEGRLVPDEPLSEYQLAADLKMSRTPIREALKRLEHEGLVRFVPNHGAFVRALSASDIAEVYQVREQLEGLAAFIAAATMSDGEIAELEHDLTRAMTLAAQNRIAETFESDIKLHQRIVACTHNERLTRILETLGDQVHRIRILAPNTPGRLDATLGEHRDILECIKRRDGEGARAAMSRHLQNAQRNALQLLMTPGASRRLVSLAAP